MPINVLIVDDSRLMRNLLTSIVNKDAEICVLGGAENGVDALEKIKQLQPDVVLLDLNMPVMDGLTLLREARKRELPNSFLVVSSLAKEDAQITLDALSLGAVDYVQKPPQTLNIEQLSDQIIKKVHVAYDYRLKTGGSWPEGPLKTAAEGSEQALAEEQRAAEANTVVSTAVPGITQTARIDTGDLWIVGGSSGAIQSVRRIVPELRGDFSSTLVVVLPQPPFFITQFVNELMKISKVPVLEAKDGMEVRFGHAYVAPGGRLNLDIEVVDGKKVFRLIENLAGKVYTPSIDVFMHSAAEVYKDKCHGVLVSGTGDDGVMGLKQIRSHAGKTYVEIQKSAIAYQLPAEALKLNLVDEVVDLPDLVRQMK